MSVSRHRSRDASPCDCCTGVSVHTPATIYNRPGLSSIGYRVGRHAEFKQSMLARLSGVKAAALNNLDTRDDDDFTIALLDAWATTADVLTFYQERIANESFLRTATERFSVLELARLIGYELRPGVAASAYLAFVLDDDPGTATIAAGTQVQSIPGEGQFPQKFEISQAVEARAAWNAIKPRQTQPHRFTDGATDSEGNLLDAFYFAGLGTGLSRGDALLVDKGTGDSPELRFVSEVTTQSDMVRTKVQLRLPPSVPDLAVSFFVLPYVIKPIGAAVSLITQTYKGQTIKAAEFKAQATTQRFAVANVLKNLAATAPRPPCILAFRTKASIFGHNAPTWKALPANLRVGEVVQTGESASDTRFDAGPFSRESDWVDSVDLGEYPGSSTSDPEEKYIYLDTTYDEIVAGSVVVLQNGGWWQHYEVLEASEVSLSEFTLNGKVTRLKIRLPLDTSGSPASLTTFTVRGTTIYAQSEPLELARLPIEESVRETEIELEGWAEGLQKGQFIILCGELTDDVGNLACEHAVIDDVEHFLEHDGYTRIQLTKALRNRYVRKSVTINANVAAATHGETVLREILGSGNGAEAFQEFALRNKPLTYVSSADHPSGAVSTLNLRVDKVLWNEVDDLRDSGPNDRHYVLRHSNDGQTTVLTGDGRQGARLPTGSENVVATYRKGIGRDGNVAANAITLLTKRPLGVRSVTNPLMATGGGDPESLNEAQQNAPLTVLTLDRIVSLQDYEDFARAFAGISKALATWTWFGQERGVFLTVAGIDGVSLDSEGDTYKNLLAAMRAAGDPSVPLRVAVDPSYHPVYFQVEGKIEVQGDYLAEDVLAAIESMLRDRFSFEKRAFGQAVIRSEVIAAIQNIPGVISVDVDAFYRGETRSLETRLVAAAPQAGSRNGVEPAELLILDPRPLALGVKKNA